MRYQYRLLEIHSQYSYIVDAASSVKFVKLTKTKQQFRFYGWFIAILNYNRIDFIKVSILPIFRCIFDFYNFLKCFKTIWQTFFNRSKESSAIAAIQFQGCNNGKWFTHACWFTDLSGKKILEFQAKVREKEVCNKT